VTLAKYEWLFMRENISTWIAHLLYRCDRWARCNTDNVTRTNLGCWYREAFDAD